MHPEQPFIHLYTTVDLGVLDPAWNIFGVTGCRTEMRGNYISDDTQL